MFITPVLAQQIIESVMSIVPHNGIHIMDLAGMIIATDDKLRKLTFHQGAKNAIEYKCGIEIFPDEIGVYQGSLPGVDLPIILEDQVVGVVGVSGHPNEVRSIAKLIKSITELMLERELLRDEFRSQYKIKEQFVSALLFETKNSNTDRVKRTASLLGFDLTLPRIVAIIDIQELIAAAYKTYAKTDLVSLRIRDQLLQFVLDSSLINQTDLVVYLDNQIVILKHILLAAPNDSIVAWGTKLYNDLVQKTGKPFLKVGIGSRVLSWSKLKNSYEEALFALAQCSYPECTNTIYNYDVLVKFLLNKLVPPEQCEIIEGLRQKLEQHVTKYDLKATVACLLKNNLNISLAAKQLFIHRNTLLFRLAKLQEITGLDLLHNLNHAILCKMLFF